MTEKDDLLLKRIADHLIINASFMSDLGLYNGKMGVVLFFAHYGRYTNNSLYDDFAGELLDEIYDEIFTGLPIDFENGLCGIAWGIEYLVQNGFMGGNTDDILKDVDRRVMECDIRHVSDLSFRKGLAGITFYIIARLSSFREKRELPFDSVYLNDLKEALLNSDFLETDEVTPLLVKNYLCALEGIKTGKLNLPQLSVAFTVSTTRLHSNLSSLPLGLENGVAGTLLDLILSQECEQVIEKKDLSRIEKDCLFIFDEESPAANYGIGAYICQLTEALRRSKWVVTIVHLRWSNIDTFYVEQKEEIQHIYIANIKRADIFADREMIDQLYYRNILLLLRPYFKNSKKMLFHLNYMHMAELAVGLKIQFPQSEVIATVHYMEWSFELLGDKLKLIEILKHPEKKEYKTICKSVEYERRFLNVCDRIIAVAQHSYESLRYIYEIPEVKLTKIAFGLQDKSCLQSKNEVKMLRRKYGFSLKEKIVVFAGRLDTIKGIEILAAAFVGLAQEYPELRLIIAGDGNYNNILSEISPCWSKVVFTGFVNKTILYELFSISDVGVAPSLHEEFGIVALEMMMIGLPLIVGRTTGLCELVVNEKTGITVPLNSNVKSENVDALKDAIELLINNKIIRQSYSKLGRKRFLKTYYLDQFAERIINYYNNG